MSAKTGSRPGKTSVSAVSVSVSAARVGGERTGEVSSSDSSRADSPTRRAEASAKKQLSNNSDDAHGRRVGGHSWLAPVFKMLRAMRDESEKGAIELEGQLEIVTNHFSLIQASIDELKTHWEPRAEILGALD